MDKEKAQQLLNKINDLDPGIRLKAIDEAIENFNTLFSPEKPISELAYSAMFVESLYNLIRDQIKQAFVILVPENGSETRITEKVKQKAEVRGRKKKIPPMQDPEFLATLKNILASPSSSEGGSDGVS
jgi:hypothetical protein